MLTTPLLVANACICASVKLTPPTVMPAMPSVADTPNVPVTVSPVSATDVSPRSVTVASGPLADAVTTLASSSAPWMVTVSVAADGVLTPSVMV